MFYEDIKKSGATFIFDYLGQDGIDTLSSWQVEIGQVGQRQFELCQNRMLQKVQVYSFQKEILMF